MAVVTSPQGVNAGELGNSWNSTFGAAPAGAAPAAAFTPEVKETWNPSLGAAGGWDWPTSLATNQAQSEQERQARAAYATTQQAIDDRNASVASTGVGSKDYGQTYINAGADELAQRTAVASALSGTPSPTPEQVNAAAAQYGTVTAPHSNPTPQDAPAVARPAVQAQKMGAAGPTAADITSAYQAQLGRAPDAAGLAWWMDPANGFNANTFASGAQGTDIAARNGLSQGSVSDSGAAYAAGAVAPVGTSAGASGGGSTSNPQVAGSNALYPNSSSGSNAPYQVGGQNAGELGGSWNSTFGGGGAANTNDYSNSSPRVPGGQPTNLGGPLPTGGTGSGTTIDASGNVVPGGPGPTYADVGNNSFSGTPISQSPSSYAGYGPSPDPAGQRAQDLAQVNVIPGAQVASPVSSSVASGAFTDKPYTSAIRAANKPFAA